MINRPQERELKRQEEHLNHKQNQHFQPTLKVPIVLFAQQLPQKYQQHIHRVNNFFVVNKHCVDVYYIFQRKWNYMTYRTMS